MSQIYQVPIVSNGLRETESILQIVDSLDKLDKVFNDIYNNISNRVMYEKSRIDSVNDRLENAQFKVNQVVGSKSAITIFSSAKYPADKKWLDYKPLNSGKVKLPYKPSHYHGLHHDAGMKQLNPEDSYLDVNDLVFIEKSIDAASKEIERAEGLGRLPGHLTSISNLILFNTSENPYKKYSNTLDNLAGAQGEEQLQIFGEQVDKKKLPDAPHTVEKGDHLLEATKESYKFVHSSFAKPSYSFPSDLPLPNIAANIGWQNNENTTIAPSNLPSNNTLPVYGDGSQEMASPSTGPLDMSAPGLAVPQSSQTMPSSIPPPPPPPPMASNVPPPPPPPPVHSNIPPPPPSLNPTALVDDLDDDQSAQNNDGSAIGNLLADIRKGHKSRLKSVKSEDQEESDEPPPPPKSSGGDVMSDLFLALARRRSSIASTKKTSNSKKEEYSDEEKSDSDWDDK